MTLADRIAIMRDGKILQLGSPDEIYNMPINKYVADFIGSPAMNFIRGIFSDGYLQVEEHRIPLLSYHFQTQPMQEQVIWMGIRPEHVVTGAAVQGADYQTTVKVDIIEPMGADTLVWAKFSGQPFRIRLPGLFPIKVGEPITIGITCGSTSLFDRETEERL